MEKIDKILAKSLAKRGLSKATQGAMVCFYAKEWANGLFEPISFTEGTLKVSVCSSPAASELQIQESKLLDHLNEKIGKRIVRQLRIVVFQSRK